MKKKANNVSPAVHEEVNRHVVDGNNTRSLEQQAQMEFVIAKRLLACLPITPTNERIFELAQDLRSGLFDDLGDVFNCEQNWEEWVERTYELLRARKVIISRLKHNKLEK